MIRKLAHYEVRTEALPQALEAVRAFIDEVERKEGGTASYRAYQEKEHANRFTHMMEFRTPAAEDYHRKTAWNKKFVEVLYPLCTKEPEFVEIQLVEKA